MRERDPWDRGLQSSPLWVMTWSDWSAVKPCSHRVPSMQGTLAAHFEVWMRIDRGGGQRSLPEIMVKLSAGWGSSDRRWGKRYNLSRIQHKPKCEDGMEERGKSNEGKGDFIFTQSGGWSTLPDLAELNPKLMIPS